MHRFAHATVWCVMVTSNRFRTCEIIKLANSLTDPLLINRIVLGTSSSSHRIGDSLRLELDRHLVWALVTLDDPSHLNLHLLEVIDKLVLSTEVDMTHLVTDLLLQRSVAL